MHAFFIIFISSMYAPAHTIDQPIYLQVLACAPSNIAVDNLVERLASKGAKVVRLGHPARLVSSVVHHSLDSLLNNYDGSDIVKDIRKEMSKTIVSRIFI